MSCLGRTCPAAEQSKSNSEHYAHILVFFVSMQYLRLSQFVGGKEKHLDPLKKSIMEYDWDFVMVDEAHEGIEAAAGLRVMEKLKKEKTRILSLSGTPFNLLDKYEESEIYTWDYVMEQKAKQKWDEEHFGDPNPYADLPRMQILTGKRFTSLSMAKLIPKWMKSEPVKRYLISQVRLQQPVLLRLSTLELFLGTVRLQISI